MYYVSTRDAGRRLTASQAIVEGLSRDGGLYLPEEIPQLTMDEIKALAALSYPERAARLMKRYLDEFTEEELLGFAKSAYGPAKFDTPAAAPVVKLTENTYIQELWHGPTCAFKDMALQMLPYLLTASLRKTGEEKTVCILVATSGDTGKAALEGFRDVDRTKILVFYPDGGVSEMQKLQMVTQEGKNVGVCAVRGNFDDAQTGVKRIFSDEALREELAGRGYFLSSANSINWGRLLPQIVYYVSAYCDLLNAGTIEAGTRVNFCVPTGNFGNILSGTVISALIYAALVAANSALFHLLASSMYVALIVTIVGLIPLIIGFTKKKKKLKILGIIVTVLGVLAILTCLGVHYPWLTIGIPAIPSLYFDWFSGCIQAFIFCTLTTLFIKQAAG